MKRTIDNWIPNQNNIKKDSLKEIKKIEINFGCKGLKYKHILIPDQYTLNTYV